MIITNLPPSPNAKCDRCGKVFEAKPYSGHVPMCGNCHTFQTLCPACCKKGCIVCGKVLGKVIY